jgi:DNA polymerase-3 subunit gamma/tau
MPYVALARKWRPQKFEDVIGQRGVVDTLKNAIDAGRLAQSFIFAGPRGVGKTTTARILARALNCEKGPTPEPCGKCDSCVEIAEGRDMDVLEIDAATYTGVDAVREVIIEPLGIAPMRDRFKIFIIDEVHRLSKNAFDALLKSIEEPPPHAKFMMATTELDKVPVTITSRSQVFELKALGFAQIKQQLKDIATSEKITIEDAALALVARAAEGSMRDALSALDQVLAFTDDKVSAKDVSTVLGLIGRDLQFEIADTVAREDAAAVFGLGERVLNDGFDLRIVCRELARLMRDLMVIKIDPSRVDDPELAAEGEKEPLLALAKHFSREDLMRAFDLLSRAEYDIRSSSHPRHHFEMALMKWIHLRQLTPLTELLRGGSPGASGPSGPAPPVRKFESPRRPDSSAGPSPAAAPKPAPPQPKPSSTAAKAPERPVAVSAEAPSAAPVGDLKSAMMSTIRESNKVFFSMVVAQAQSVEVEGDSIVFAFAPVHKSLRQNFEGRRGWLEQMAAQIAGKPIKILSKDGDPAIAAEKAAATTQQVARQTELKAKAKAEPAVQNILDVFGGEIEAVEERSKHQDDEN